MQYDVDEMSFLFMITNSVNTPVNDECMLHIDNMPNNEVDATTPLCIQDVSETLNEYMDDVDARLTAQSAVYEQMHDSIKQLREHVIDLSQRLDCFVQHNKKGKDNTEQAKKNEQIFQKKYEIMYKNQANIIKNNKKLANDIKHEQWNMLFLLAMICLTYFSAPMLSSQ